MKKLLGCFLLILFGLSVFANVQLPKIFGDHMVLQRDREIVLWGWADPKEKITVQFNKQTKTVTAGKDGKWKLSLAAEAAGGPFQLIVKGKNTLTYSDVLVGEVWICSGQSNMEWSVRNSNNATTEIVQGNFPAIRHIKIPNTIASAPQQDIKSGEWKICSPETVGDFTAVGYFFARELTRELNVPVGLINTSWGGTHVETWTSREAFENSDEFKTMIASMPKLNLDSLAKVKTATNLKKIQSLQGAVNESTAVVNSWKETSFDDSRWKKMNVPELWESQELGDFDGVVWFRKTINLPAAEAGKEGWVALSMIDDSDETFINGVPVGKTMWKYNEQRNYKIPQGILKEGKNVIAVRVEDTGGGGGIYGAGDLKISAGNFTFPLAGEWNYRVESLLQNSGGGVGPNSYPTLLFNAMLNPLIPYTIKGALWYQGESNAGRAYQYRKAFPLMISDWRKRWGQGDFPFYFVQLASFDAGHGTSKTGSNWAELREAQTLTLSLPNTGMAVTTDIGEPHDIHPRNKQDVGKRLAAVALNKTYGKSRVDSGPVFQTMEVKGDRIVVTFTNIGGGLQVKDRYGYVKGFEIAGADKQFYYAKASIEGNTVVVYHDQVKNPVAVRFGWADEASDTNLFNAEGFPAVPFRSDTWRGITEGGKFTIGH
jgi:sialate O-acetylesterase